MIQLDCYELSEIQNNYGAIGPQLRNSLDNAGAIGINFKSAISGYNRSMAYSQLFFGADETSKIQASGSRYYAERFRDAELSFRFSGTTYRVSKAIHYARERGWLARGASPSGADKEIYQYGFIRNYGTSRVEKVNIWPTGEASRRFISSKVALAGIHEEIHLSVARALDYDRRFDADVVAYPYELLCRDTKYFPRTVDSALEGESSTTSVRNPGHVDISDSTIVHFSPGFQIYRGKEGNHFAIKHDSSNWHDVVCPTLELPFLIYFFGLATEISSGGMRTATWHRVIAKQQKEQARFSIASFFNKGIDDLLRPSNQDHGGEAYPAIRRIHLPIVGNVGYINSLNDDF